MEVFRFVVFWSHIILSTSLENLAYNKSATQSSNLNENMWLAEAAVDGNGNQILTGNSCACTAYYKPTVWWKVDLGNVYAISNVKIFNRNEGRVFRLTGFKLYVTLEDNFISSSPVYVNNNGEQEKPYTPANFTVTVATYGQYVTLYKDRSGTCTGDGASSSSNTNYCALFELCEVEVLGCPRKKYGTDCQSDCPDNCLYGVCDVSDGKCYQCKAGYTGDMCNQQNLAYNRSATQSSNLHENKWLAGAAVDGNGNQILTGNSCACTAHFKPTVWWKVDLGNVYAISNVKIFNRDEGTTFRLTGFKLYVTLEDNFISSSPVYVNNNGVQIEPYLPANFTVTVATYGQYVTLYKDRSVSCTGDGSSSNTNYCALFELCEVEVLGCPKKKYGTDCQSDCPGNCLYDVCAVSDGKCYQCKAGYTGDMCDQLCGNGKYGYNCNDNCTGNCQNGLTCNVQTGYCDNGCAAGWEGDKCNTVCSSGKYGLNCLNNCTGNCANEKSCSPIDGICQYGCKSGWTGDICNQVCESGKYGPGCTDTCGRCINSTICDRQTGVCQQGCTDGFKGTLCRERCNIGYYGPNCLLKCSKCNSTCDYVTGKCPVSDVNISNGIQDLKLSFIVYGVISSVIICVSAVLNIWFLRTILSLRSEKHTRKSNLEFSLSEITGIKDNSGDLSKTSSGESKEIVSCNNQESKTDKYEELGHILAEKGNYENLRKGDESVQPQHRETKDSCNGLVKKDGGADDTNYEELLCGTAENSYESLRDDENSKYANA